MKSLVKAMVTTVGLLGSLALPAQVPEAPLSKLEPLAGKTWRAEGTGFTTTLSYRWLFPGRVLEASNDVLDARGRTIARYVGAYAWDAGRREIAFWTVAESGEVHRGRAWWRDGVLWHEAEVSGGRINAYASAIRVGPDAIEYFADYGARQATDSIFSKKPLVYRVR